MNADSHRALYASPLKRWLVILSVMIPSAVYVLDLTVVTVALPHMQGTFSATHDQISWVITSYIVGGTIMTGCSGWVSRRFGRKEVFLASCALFTAMSLMCGLARSLEAEVLWRAIQGLSGAPILPLSQAVMFDLYPKERHGTANSIWGMGILLGPVLGPTVGGYFTEWYGWPWAFFINVPAMIVPLAGVIFILPRVRRETDRRLDWFGFLALLIGVGALQLALNRGEREDWFASTEISIEAGLAAVFLYLFVVQIATGRDPFIRPAVFRDWNYSLGLVFAVIFSFVLQSPIVLLSLFFQNLGGYPVFDVGLLLTPRGIGAFTSMALGGVLIAHFDPRWVMATGFVCFGFSAWLIAGWTTDVSAWQVAWTGIIQGLGSGFVWVPLGTLSVATLAPERRDEALAFMHMMFNVGASLGIVILINVALRTSTMANAWFTEFATPFNPSLQLGMAQEFWGLAKAKGRAALASEIARQASIIGYNNCFYAIAAIAAVSLPFSFLMKRAVGSANAGHVG
ncbi:MAG: DHA2 family efflux MFS transporter permease subunit [Alphaproteobacteria bacterium]